MKKITIIVLMIMLGAIITPISLKPILVQAEDGNQNIHNNNGEVNNSEDQNNDEQDNEEHDIFSSLKEDHAKSPQIVLPVVDDKSLVTYADVLVVVKSYEVAISQLDASAGIDTSTMTLTSAEKTLLNSLLLKHKSHIKHLDLRIAETKAQLKSFEEILSPLGNQTISTSFGIKDLIIIELNNYRDIIMGISDFDDLNTNILEQETD